LLTGDKRPDLLRNRWIPLFFMSDDPEQTTNPEAGDERPVETNGFALEQRFVLFFDFLGASSAAKNWPRERVYEFIDLLTSIAHCNPLKTFLAAHNLMEAIAFS
jgi:ADP-heptose:LPS heptosyltransferase